jgi:hypothetical protein
MAVKTVLFESDISHLILVRQPKLESPLPTGGRHTVQKTIDYRFIATPTDRTENGWCGMLRVKVGADKLTTDHEGWLRDGEDTGIERDAEAALMAHRSFGTKFWLAGHPPGTIYPRPQDLRGDIRKWTVKLDEDSLADALAKEQASHQRKDLVTELGDALALVREEKASLAASQAEAEAQVEAETAKAKAKPKAATPA